MWPAGGWGQWPIQQANFANVPHENIDWAALAKQWIEHKDTTVPDAALNAQVPQSTQVPHSHNGNFPKSEPMPVMAGMDQSAMMAQPQNWAWGGMPGWGPGAMPPPTGWSMPPPGPPPGPPPPPAPPTTTTETVEPSSVSVDYGHTGIGFSSFDYNHGDGQFYPGMVGSGFSDVNNYWPPAGQSSQGSSPDPHIDRHRTRTPPPPHMPEPMMELDAAKRKKLPAWIREGLEKVEREKQKQIEKERQEKEREEAKKTKEELEKKAVEELKKNPAKSKFDDSDVDSEVEIAVVLPIKETVKTEDEDGNDDEPESKAASPKASSPPTEVLSEEERQAQLMVRVRRMLTEILLDVTNQEIEDVASEVHRRAKVRAARAPAKQLGKSTALASLTGLGLGYGTDSEDEEEAPAATDQHNDDSESSDTDQETLMERVRQKKKSFAKKMQELEDEERRKEREYHFLEKVSEPTTKLFHKNKTIPGLGDENDDSPSKSKYGSSKKKKVPTATLR